MHMSLKVSGLTKYYGEKQVVDHLSFEMHQGGVYALLGTNGAGKTTSIRMILGMLARDRGQVLWNGKELTTANCNVGYLAEERGLYPKYPLMDQLMYFAALRGVPRDVARRRIGELAGYLAVEEYLYPPKKPSRLDLVLEKRRGPAPAAQPIGKLVGKSLKADQLSKGNQQKIQLMAALISDPELIVLDEPLSGLDPVNAELFKKIIRREVEKGKYIIMSSHQMATVEEFCTDITILDRSKTVLQGHLNDIKKSYGRVNLRLKAEQDVSRWIEQAGAHVVSQKEWEYEIKVTGEEQANALLRQLIDAGVHLVAFDLREPSLNEIFVEKVGRQDERA